MTERSVDQLLADARDQIQRVGPAELERWRAEGALIVDIRPERQRAAEGDFDGAIVVERNVLEWRFDPHGEHTLPEVESYDQRVIVVCSEGYASSFAAASLRALGFHRVADLDGGYWAWRVWRDDIARRA
jgi:rhodanese-related sulfurtransferase